MEYRMPTSGLEFFTSQELIHELVNRKTFLGVIVHSHEDLKESWQGERVFQVHFNDNLDASRASRLMEILADRMEDREEIY
jgi:hypothetical protein